MATGGEVGGQLPGSVHVAGSEDLSELKCQPCYDDGIVREAVGMCTECQDYLCRKCFDSHTIPKPMRKHQLLDKQQMLDSPVKRQRKDFCTKTCSLHDDDVIKYYCIKHGNICCSACLSLDHRTCKKVQYIPHAAKDLDNNREFKKANGCLHAAVTHCKTLSDSKTRAVEEIDSSCSEAIKRVETHRRAVNDALDKIHTAIVEKADTMKVRALKKITNITDKYREAQRELQEFKTRSEQLQRRQQNCDLYTEMMQMKDRLKVLQIEMKKAGDRLSLQATEIKFTPNLELLETLKNTDMFGKLTGAESGTIVKAEYLLDIDVETTIYDEKSCITGSTFLPDGKLVISDADNCVIKVVDEQQHRVIDETYTASSPSDVCTIKEDQVATTLPGAMKIALINVGDNMGVDRTLSVYGECCGVDYKDGKLAVSFTSKPSKVQVLNLQGDVLHDITTDQRGRKLFDGPFYLTFDQAGTTLYVPNRDIDNVVRVKLDGTLVATYTNNELFNPTGAVVDSDGNVYVCSNGSDEVYQISTDCRKLQMLQDDGLVSPRCISYKATDDTFWVGTANNINVYQAIRDSR